MSNAMTHEPISYLDSILNEEEKRCEYGHQWRNFTISRSGRFKSKNKKRDIVDGKLFDSNATATATAVPTPTKDECGRYKEQDKFLSSCQSSTSSKSYQQQSTAKASSSTRVRDKPETYKSYYETNL